MSNGVPVYHLIVLTSGDVLHVQIDLVGVWHV